MVAWVHLAHTTGSLAARAWYDAQAALEFVAGNAHILPATSQDQRSMVR